MKQQPHLTLHQRLFTSLLAAWSLLLTSSVRVASLAMQPQLVELWKCRVQHLRKYYCDQKHKQQQYSVISGHVWYFPVILSLWLIIMSCSTLLALLVNVATDTGMHHSRQICPSKKFFLRVYSG